MKKIKLLSTLLISFLLVLPLLVKPKVNEETVKLKNGATVPWARVKEVMHNSRSLEFKDRKSLHKLLSQCQCQEAHYSDETKKNLRQRGLIDEEDEPTQHVCNILLSAFLDQSGLGYPLDE